MVKQNRLSQKLISGSIWTFASSGFQAITRLAVLALLARLLTPSEFGLVAAVTSVIGFSELLTQAGLAPALVQKRDVTREDIVTAQTLSIILTTTAAAVVALSSSSISELYQMAAIEPMVEIAALAFLFRGLSALARAKIQRRLEFPRAVKIETFSALIGYVGVVVPLALLGYGAWAPVSALVTEALVSFLVYSWFDPPELSLRFYRNSMASLMRFGFGFSIGQVFGRIADEIDFLLVGRMLGAEALGLYSRAFQLVVGQTKRFGRAFDQVLFPVLATLQEQPERLASGYHRTLTLIFLSSTLLSLFAWLLAPHLVTAFLGSQWVSAIAPFSYLALGIAPRATTRINGSILKATGHVYILAALRAANVIWVVGGVLLGIPYGIDGVAAGVSCAFFVHFLLSSSVIALLYRLPVLETAKSLAPAFVALLVVAPIAIGMGLLGAELDASFWMLGLLRLLGFLLALSVLFFLVPSFLLGEDFARVKDKLIQKVRG